MTESGLIPFFEYLQLRKRVEELKQLKAEEKLRPKAKACSAPDPVAVLQVIPLDQETESSEKQTKKVVPKKPLVPQASERDLSPKITVTRPPSPTLNRIEDYTGSLCLLHTLTDMTPYYFEILIDIDDFERVTQHSWIVVYEGKYREPRVARSVSPRYLHRFVMDDPNGLVVDHRFHNTLDARKATLRPCTTGQNNLNRRPRRNASSRFKGVSLCKRSGKWKVMCGARGFKVFLGSFDSETDAALVYNQFAVATYGSMAYQNPIE